MRCLLRTLTFPLLYIGCHTEYIGIGDLQFNLDHLTGEIFKVAEYLGGFPMQSEVTEQEASSRKLNYIEAERENCLNIVEHYKNVIDNKETDGVSIQNKEDCWQTFSEWRDVLENENETNIDHNKFD